MNGLSNVISLIRRMTKQIYNRVFYLSYNDIKITK